MQAVGVSLQHCVPENCPLKAGLFPATVGGKEKEDITELACPEASVTRAEQMLTCREGLAPDHRTGYWTLWSPHLGATQSKALPLGAAGPGCTGLGQEGGHCQVPEHGFLPPTPTAAKGRP
jgi:hypothetical protein